FTLHTYGVFVAAGFLTGLVVAVKIGKSEGISPQQTMDMGFFMIAAGILGSRLLYILMNLSYYLDRPLDMVKMWEGGLVFSGGIVCVILVVLWYTRRHRLSFWKIADIWAPAMAIGQAIGRIGCFMAGCCYGKPTGSDWGVVFTDPRSLAPLNVPLHPTQLYSSGLNLIVFFILILLHRKKEFEGQVFLWLLVLHSTARLFVERFRGDDRGMIFQSGMTVTQLVTLVILMGAILALFIFKRRHTRN
ncbi:MAG: prolipoprotein diacylglyceryl transferase, partial [Deltaproteobacteria bacterium]|nr:prolipoprotein diacylglyceryl transferase [Deltaproteobacteria bacterium]